MTQSEFLDLLRTGLGLDYREDQLALPLDDLDGWDSVHLLRLMTLVPGAEVERVLVAETLDGVRLAVAPAVPA